jgi:hypothetical protein
MTDEVHGLLQGGHVMTCLRCNGLMVEDHFFDFEGTYGFMWMRGWRCMNCGHAADPIIEANRRLHVYHRVAA